MGSLQSPPGPPGDLAEHTVQRIQNFLRAGDVACLAEIVSVISEIANRAHTISVQDLADVVSRDVSIMTKVLCAANTVAYNPWGIQVTTVSQAIQVVGLNKVRDLALAIMLLERSESRLSEEEHREIAALSLASGLVAQSLAGRLDLPNVEQAFVCATLRNYGRLLMATFLTDDHHKARSLAAEIDEDAAYRSIFGLTPLELSATLLASNNLPEAITKTLRTVPPEVLSAATKTADDQLTLLGELSVKLCEAVDRNDPNAPSVEARVRPLIQKYGRAARFGMADLQPVMQEVEMQIATLGKVCGVNTFRCTLTNRLVAISQGRNPYAAFAPQPTPAAPAAAATAPPPPAPAGPPPTEDPDANIFSKAISDLARLMSGAGGSLDAVYTLVEAAIHDGLRLQQTIVFLLADQRPVRLVARSGRGHLLDEIRGRKLLDASNRDVFSVSLTRGEDVVIQNAGTPQIRPFIPTWLKASTDNNSLLLLPLRHGEELYGLVCGIGRPAAPVRLAPTTVQQLRLLRANAAIAREVLGQG